MSFFSDYYNFVKEDEPPLPFQLWTSLTVVSALLGRSVFFPMGHFNVFPNLYVLLVGNPGSRKTTAMNVGRDFLRDSDLVPMAPSSSTRESLIQHFTEPYSRIEFSLGSNTVSYRQQTVMASEFSEFIGGKHINDDMIRFLTGIWDENKFVYTTRNKGSFEIDHPYLCMIGCCTSKWLQTQMKSNLITDGFARRMCFVHQESLNKSVTFPELSLDQLKAMKNVNSSLPRIFNLKGMFKVTLPAREYFEHFYTDLNKRIPNAPPILQYFYSSKATLALKVAMCISAGITDTLVIDSQMLKLAVKLLDETERDMMRLLGGLGRNELKPFFDEVLLYIQKRACKVSLGEIIDQFSKDLSMLEINEAITALVESKALERSVAEDGQGFLYRSTECHVARSDSNLFQELAALSARQEGVYQMTVANLELLHPDLKTAKS